MSKICSEFMNTKAKAQALREKIPKKRGYESKYHWTVTPMCSPIPKIIWIIGTNYKVYKWLCWKGWVFMQVLTFKILCSVTVFTGNYPKPSSSYPILLSAGFDTVGTWKTKQILAKGWQKAEEGNLGLLKLQLNTYIYDIYMH